MKSKMILKNERGVALLMVMLIATIILSVTTTMLYMLTQSTRYSGLSKRFATASEAAYSATEVVTDYIGKKSSTITPAYIAKLATDLGFADQLSSTCDAQKIKFDTSDWDPSCSKTVYMDPTDPATYDYEFLLGEFKVVSKIVYTFKGINIAADGASSGGSGGAGGVSKLPFINNCVVHCEGGSTTDSMGGDGIGSTAGGFGGVSIPSVYVVEVDASNINRPAENAKLSILFQF